MFKDNFRYLRISKGYSQTKIADFLGVKPQTVSSWELGRTEPNIEQMKKIAHLFSCTLEDLAKDSETTPEDIKKGIVLIEVESTETMEQRRLLRLNEYYKRIHKYFLNDEEARMVDALRAAKGETEDIPEENQ